MLSTPQWPRAPAERRSTSSVADEMIVARLEAAAVGVFDALMHLEDRLDVGEARLSGVASIRGDPVDDARGGVGARLDPAVAFFERRLGRPSSASGAASK